MFQELLGPLGVVDLVVALLEDLAVPHRVVALVERLAVNPTVHPA